MQSFHYNQRNYLNSVAENIFFDFHTGCTYGRSVRSFIPTLHPSINPKKNRTCNIRSVIKSIKYNSINYLLTSLITIFFLPHFDFYSKVSKL